MKKVYALLSIILMGSAAVGQSGNTDFKQAAEKKYAQERSFYSNQSTHAQHATDRIDLYYTDFDGGLPADWSEFTETGPCSWEWTDEGHMGDFPSASLESTTADNGWMILDSDLCGAEGGDTEVAFLIGPSVDCSGYDNVAIRFEQYFRRYAPAAEITSLQVSIDGFASFEEYVFNEDIDSEGTVNPSVIQQDISDIAANESDVQFRFRWEGTWGYGWQIDDVTVLVPDDNDLVLENPAYGNYDPDADPLTWENLSYTVYHTGQLRPLFFNADVSNIGLVEQTNVVLNVTIEDGEGFSETVSSSPIVVAPGENINIELDGYTPPAVAGTYTASFELTQAEDDVNTDNNVGSRTFLQSDDIFARDFGITNNPSANVANDVLGDLEAYGNGFYFTQDGNIHCVGAAFHEDSEVNSGVFFRARVRDAGMDPLAESPELSFEALVDDGSITLNTDGDGEFYWIDLGAPFAVEDEDELVVTVDNETFADGRVLVGTSGTSPNFSAYTWGGEASDGSVCDPCYTTVSFMVRLGMTEEFCDAQGNNTSITEIDAVSKHALFPNPTDGQTTLEYTLLEQSEIQIFLFDSNGRIIMQEDKGTQPVGEYRFDYDFSGFATGNYTMSIMIGEKAINQKLIIK